jgi:hypothetical protein
VRIVADRKAREYLLAQGGTATVTARSQRCCTGALTTLVLRTEAPDDPTSYERLVDNGLVVYYRSARGAHPDELVLKLKGSRHPRIEALWDGCAYAI